MPGLTCMCRAAPADTAGAAPRMPLSNTGVKKGMKTALGAVGVDPTRFLTDGT